MIDLTIGFEYILFSYVRSMPCWALFKDCQKVLRRLDLFVRNNTILRIQPQYFNSYAALLSGTLTGWFSLLYDMYSTLQSRQPVPTQASYCSPSHAHEPYVTSSVPRIMTYLLYHRALLRSQLHPLPAVSKPGRRA